jgi:hypothetical protein
VQSIVWNNTTFGTAPGSEQVWASGVMYSIVEGGFVGVGNSSGDPLLDGQHKPGAGSPAIDGGHPGYPLDADGTLMDLGFYDGDAVDRNQNGYPDAFEFALLAASDCNANGFWDPIEAGSAVSTDFDGDGNPDDCVAPALNVDVTELSLASGGEQVFTLAPPVGGELYVLVGSLASPPGSTPVGGLVVPLTADAYTTWILSNLGSPALMGFVGVTVASGTQAAKLSVPAGFNPALAGQTATHAYLTADPVTGAFTFVSNPVPLLLQ